ncbi:MAG: hypothetical protein FWE05_06145 [Defluviitaleaceae bacterium]|nr:hypothetical protein [Defluviitaleaceae bacterium]
MFKRFIAIALSTMLLGASVVIAEEKPAEIQSENHAGVYASGFEVFPDIFEEPPVFDDVIDQIYFNIFRDGFEFIRQNSVPIHQVITYGHFEMEVISSIALASRQFAHQNWLTDDWFTIDLDTGYFSINEDAEYEIIDMLGVDVRTFFSLRDVTGEVQLDWSTMINLGEDFDRMHFIFDPVMARAGFGNVSFVHFDVDTGTAYFLASHSASAMEGQNVIVDFAVSSILANNQRNTEEIAIDFIEILANHEATFILEDDGREIMQRGELDIYLFEDIYLTNIAVRDNFLHIQTSEPMNVWHEEGRWAHVQLFNPAVEMPDLEALFENVDWETVDEDFWAEIDAMWRGRYPQSLFSSDVTEWEMITRAVQDIPFEQPESRIIEHVFYFEDMNVLADLVFEGVLSYFAFSQNVDLSIDEFELPVINFMTAFEDIEIEIDGDTYLISNLRASLTEISFALDGDGMIFYRLRDVNPHVSLQDYITIHLVYAEGPDEFISWSGGMGFSRDEYGAINDLTVSFGGSFIFIENLVGLYINGVFVSVK